MRRHHLLIWLVTFSLLSILAFFTVSPAHAATFTVNSTGDGGDANFADGLCADAGGACTLRAAIEQANNLAGDDIINFDPGITLINVATPLVITYQNITINGTGVTVNNTGATSSSNVFVVEAANLTLGDFNGLILDGLTVTGGTADYGGGVSVGGSGMLTLQDGAQVTGNSATYGGGIYAYTNSTVIVTGSGTAVSHNTATGFGGGIAASSARQVSILDRAEVSHNTATNFGGGIAAQSSSTVTLDTGALVTDNAASGAGVGRGSGIYARDSQVTITGSGTAVTANSGAPLLGSGIYADNSLISVLSGGTVSNHTGTTEAGSGVYLTNNSQLIVDNGSISGNTNATDGGGVYVNGGNLIIRNGGLVSGNDAISYGSGIYATNSAIVQVTGSGSAVADNGSASKGGGIYASGGTRVILSNGGAIRGQHASSGGGVWLTDSGTRLEMSSGATISGNSAVAGGGVGIFTGAILLMQSGAQISGNSANFGSGAWSALSAQVIVADAGTAITGNTGTGTGAVEAELGSIVRIQNGATVSNNTITGTGGQGAGVSLLDAGTSLLLSNATITGNTGAEFGGGVYAPAGTSVIVQNGGVISNNTASYGGGIYADTTTVTVTGAGSAVTGNAGDGFGTGIYALHTPVSFQAGAVVSNNIGTNGRGSGIYLNQSSTLTADQTTISGNTEGGIFIETGTTVTLSNSTVSSNMGSGGIINYGTATITNSTLSGNSSGGGGGIYNYGSLTMTNSTLFGNSSSNYGGGLQNDGTATLTNSTLSGNSASRSGGGLANSGALNLYNSIVANSTGGDCVPLSSGTLNAQYSLIMDGSCGVTSGVNGNQTGNPLLGALANNGGLTLTMALQTGSPAINTGNNALIPGGVSYDQRGTGYLRIHNGTVDMGAYESNQPTHLVFTQQPTDSAVGATISPAVKVELRDENDQLVTSATNSVTLSINNNPGGATLGGTTSVNAVGGVATFSDLSLDHNGVGYTLDASAIGLPNATSSTFSISGYVGLVVISETDPSLVITDAGNLVAEGASIGDRFLFRLNQKPTADVTVTFSSSDPTQLEIIDPTVVGRYAPADSYTVTFSASGAHGAHTVPWNSPVVINLYGVPDAVVEGAQTYAIHFTLSSGDSTFNGLSVPDEPVTVYDAGVTNTPDGLSLNEGVSYHYTVVLNAPPGFLALPISLGGNRDEQVTVTLTPDSGVTIDSSTTLTFNRSNWNVPQTVKMTATNDAVCIAPVYIATIKAVVTSNISLNPYMDSGYGGPTAPAANVGAPDMVFYIADNDCAPAVQTNRSAPPTLNGTAPNSVAPDGSGTPSTGGELPPSIEAPGSH